MTEPRPGPTLASAVAAPRQAGQVIEPEHRQREGQRDEANHEQEEEAHDGGGDAFRNGFAVVMRREDPVGLQQVQDLDTRRGVGHLESEDLDPARRRAGAAADEHQKQEQSDTERTPDVVIARRIAGSGHDRQAVEGAVAQRVVRVPPLGEPQPAGHRHDRRDGDPEKPLNLAVGHERPPAAAHGAQVEHEGQRTQHHEDHGNRLDRRVVEMTDRSVRCRIAPRRDGRHGVAERLEDRHARGPVAQAVDHGQDQIDDADGARDLCRAGQNLFRLVRRFSAEDLHAADLQHGQHRDRHDDDSDPAQPLEQRAPQKNSGRRVVEPDDDRRSRCRQARHGLEERIGVAHAEVGEIEGQGADGGNHRPAQRR